MWLSAGSGRNSSKILCYFEESGFAGELVVAGGPGDQTHNGISEYESNGPERCIRYQWIWSRQRVLWTGGGSQMSTILSLSSRPRTCSGGNHGRFDVRHALAYFKFRFVRRPRNPGLPSRASRRWLPGLIRPGLLPRVAKEERPSSAPASGFGQACRARKASSVAMRKTSMVSPFRSGEAALVATHLARNGKLILPSR